MPAEFRSPDFPSDETYIAFTDSTTPEQLGNAASESFLDMNFSPGEVDSLRDSIYAATALLGLGDIESYLAFRSAYACSMKSSAVAVAEQQFAMGVVPDLDETAWEQLSADEKFRAVASTPDARGARLLSVSIDGLRTGIGMRSSIPTGFRAQGLSSGFAPPTDGLFAQGADTAWAWMEVPVTIAASDEVLLRLEFVFDPAVSAWVVHRGSLLAPVDVELPWIVF